MSTNAQDELDIQNETNEEVYEATTTSENAEDTTEEQAPAAQDDEVVSISRSELEKYKREAAAAQRLRKRETKHEERHEESGKDHYDQNLINRTFLAAQAGIKDKEVQDEAIRLADKFGFSIAQAIDDPDISTRLQTLQKQRQAQKAVAGGTSGSSNVQKGLEYYVKKYKQTGDLPDDRKMISKILDAVADENER